MLLLTAFEAVFYYLRQSMVHFLTTRLDVKLSTYMFDKVLNLPMDFFERTQIGLVARDMREIFKIRTFLVGQLFGTILDSTTLVFFIPVMFFFSPLMTFCGAGLCRPDGGLAPPDAADLPEAHGCGTAAEGADGLISVSDDERYSNRQVACARCAATSPMGRAGGEDRQGAGRRGGDGNACVQP